MGNDNDFLKRRCCERSWCDLNVFLIASLSIFLQELSLVIPDPYSYFPDSKNHISVRRQPKSTMML
ncbi:hypothetical protein HanIR_Chr01g0011721 [Helianthus annuus]|nr:hypothetical protein HanIR_Chr01g0011721 [Helianthus annuus]